jgi:hypothetical protein
MKIIFYVGQDAVLDYNCDKHKIRCTNSKQVDYFVIWLLDQTWKNQATYILLIRTSV